MAYESAIVRSVIGNTISISAPAIPVTPITYLSSSVSSGGTSLTVQDNTGYSQNDLIMIGFLGLDRTEIKKVNAAVILGTSLTSTALTFDHAVDTQIQLTLWDQVEISGASTVTGSKTVIATVSLQVDRTVTNYVNTGTTYAFYFARYKNSVTSVFSSYSDPAAAGGYSVDTVRAVKDVALSDTNTQINTLITDAFLDAEITNCELEVFRMKRIWSWANTYNYIMGQAITGGYRIALPSDISDSNSNKSVLSVHIEAQPNLVYMTKNELDIAYLDVIHTTLATSFNAGALSIVLTSSADFADTGSITIGSHSYTYTANTRATGTLTVPATAQGETAGVDVWQNSTYNEPVGYSIFNGYLYFDSPVDSTFNGRNVYLSYYRKPTTVDTDADTLNLPDTTIYHDYLSNKILLRKNNGEPTAGSAEYRNSFLVKARRLAMQDRTGQRTGYRPRISQINQTTNGLPTLTFSNESP